MYFDKCTNLDELKASFREYVLSMHPDKGGNHFEFCEMHKEYETVLKTQHFATEQEKQREYDFIAYAKDVLDKIVHLQGIKIELIGTWIWVSGNTYDYREYLKENGLHFSGSKKAWFYNGQSKKHRTYKHYSMGDLRNMWLNMEIETNPAQTIA